MVLHVTTTLVTLECAVPVPVLTEQVCPAGCVDTVTLYAPPLGIAVWKVKLLALAETLRLSVRLSCKTSPAPVSPVIVPPTLYVIKLHVIPTLVTSPMAVPVGFATAHVSPAGCVNTVT